MKFIVISYSCEDQQNFWDIVVAVNKTSAEETVASIRNYATVVDVVTPDDLRRVLLNADAPESTILMQWDEFVKANTWHECPRCKVEVRFGSYAGSRRCPGCLYEWDKSNV